MSDKITLEQAQALIGAEITITKGRGIVRGAHIDGGGDVQLDLADGSSLWPGMYDFGFLVTAPAPAPAPAPTSANETPAARVARLRAELERTQSELEQAQTELDKVSPAFPSGWSMRDGVANGSDGEKIEVRGGTVLAMTDDEGDMIFMDLAAVRAFFARLG
jgi:hypothetical protein